MADSQPKSSGLVLGRRPLGAVLHSSNEPGELYPVITVKPAECPTADIYQRTWKKLWFSLQSHHLSPAGE